MTNKNYDHLKPVIAKLMGHFNDGTLAIQKEFPELKDNDLYVVLYEASLAVVGQVIGSAFVANPQMNQPDVYRQAAKSLQIHTQKFQEWSLLLKEQKQEEGAAKIETVAEGMSREHLLAAMGSKEPFQQPPDGAHNPNPSQVGGQTAEQLAAHRAKMEEVRAYFEAENRVAKQRMGKREYTPEEIAKITEAMAEAKPWQGMTEAGYEPVIEDLGPPTQPRSMWVPDGQA